MKIDDGDRRPGRRWGYMLCAGGDQQPDCCEEQALQDSILCCEDHVSKTPTQSSMVALRVTLRTKMSPLTPRGKLCARRRRNNRLREDAAFTGSESGYLSAERRGARRLSMPHSGRAAHAPQARRDVAASTARVKLDCHQEE